ncbi:hypothetical protein [Maricaulis sp.]|uniref:hypothetical protein n=1 Tax=Maricaulis sp. TaxID=1486257 RepID=UPI002B265EAE|nr:hypothetical protein [Maricaulis sp.]
MFRSVKTIVCGLALAIGAGGLAAATSTPSPAPAPAQEKVAEAGEKRLQRRHHRQRDHYRDRRGSNRGYSDRRGGRRDYGDRRRGRHDYRDYRRHQSRCWSESQRSRFRGRPAIVSVRVCRDRHGRNYTVRGSARLVRYLRAPRRHW